MTAEASALLTDLYQLTMLQGYFDREMEETAVFEFFIRKLPPERNFFMAAGLDCAYKLQEYGDVPAGSARKGRQPGQAANRSIGALVRTAK